MRKLFAALSTMAMLTAVPACGGSDGGDEPLDGEDEAFGGPKADGFCVDEGTIEAKGLLALVNDESVTVEELDRSASDNGAGLNKRAAENIVAARPIETLADLDAISFVGVDSCTKLLSYACDVKGLCTAAEPQCEVGNAAGRDFDVAALNDPIADLVFNSGEGCPTTYAETIAKLRQTDAEDCDFGPRSGMSTALVSEESQVTGNFDGARTVVMRSCSGRTQHEMMFSLFGISSTSGGLPPNVEVMAFDPSARVYNYYTLEQGEWEFHGNSIDYVTGGNQRCAACHTGGGPIMKELDTPWLHWEGHFDTPGSFELIDNNEDLGEHTDGADFEFVVKDGNSQWNEARVRHLVDNGSMADLLRPLFCTVEVNLDNGADFHSPSDGSIGEGDDLRDIPRDFLLDRQWSGFGGIDVSAATYQQAIMDAGQVLVGSGGQLTDANGNPSIDTIFDFVFPERSHADNNYVDRLEDAGVVDNDFVLDVLSIDFTAPIFSDARCDLLQFAPELDPADRTAANIRDGFIANLPSSGVAGELADKLDNPADSGDHQAAVEAFITACEGRDEAEFMADAMQIVSQRRALASQLSVFEFPATMPRDSLNVGREARFNPTTCVVE